MKKTDFMTDPITNAKSLLYKERICPQVRRLIDFVASGIIPGDAEICVETSSDWNYMSRHAQIKGGLDPMTRYEKCYDWERIGASYDGRPWTYAIAKK
jgi:hypothetical protein